VEQDKTELFEELISLKGGIKRIEEYYETCKSLKWHADDTDETDIRSNYPI
jgi:hypothetical protein